MGRHTQSLARSRSDRHHGPLATGSTAPNVRWHADFAHTERRRSRRTFYTAANPYNRTNPRGVSI